MALRPAANDATGSQQYNAATTGLSATALQYTGAEVTTVGVYIEDYPCHLAFGGSSVAATAFSSNVGTSAFPKDVFFTIELSSADTHFAARGIGGTAVVTLTFFAG